MEPTVRRLSRRGFLVAGGAAVGLPFLPSLARAEADARKPSKKLVIVYIPNGIVRRCFFPGEENAELPGFIGGFNADKTKNQRRTANEPGIYPLDWTPTMEPLRDHADDITMMTGLERTYKDGQDVHAQGASCYLTSLSPEQAAEQGIRHPNGRSLDQVIGDSVGRMTVFNTLEISCNGFTAPKEPIQFDNISWFDVFPLPEKLMTRHGDYLRRGAREMPREVDVASYSLAPKSGLKGVKAFPKDLRAAHGFDNQANELTLSPLLLDAFLRLSVSIVESPDFNERNVGIWSDFFHPPEAETDVKAETERRLRSFLMRAFRGPVDEATLARYVAYVSRKMDQGLPFTDSMKMATSAVLSSPKFLYRATTPDPQDDRFELASNLSFFLWSSGPDDQLLQLARRGELDEPEVLNRTIDRMFAKRTTGATKRASGSRTSCAGRCDRGPSVASNSPIRAMGASSPTPPCSA